ncbi:hypothetical protein AHAS_Ahas01G0180500 [Arachis hypogaea]
MGVPLEEMDVARQFINQKGTSLGRATWFRRCGMPTLVHYLGMPLEDPGVARQAWGNQLKMGVPLGIEGMARQLSLVTWACHLNAGRGTPATRARKNVGRGTPHTGRGTPVVFFRDMKKRAP